MEVLNGAWSSSPSLVGAATIKVPLAQRVAAVLQVVTCGPPSVGINKFPEVVIPLSL
jgi:hypothetical protein